MEPDITLVIADDHPVFRRGLKEAIEASAGFRIVGEAENGEIALRLIEEEKPAVTILDIEMPVVDGFGVARTIRRRQLPVDIIFLTMYKEENLFHEALDIGAKGYLLKENAVQDVMACIRTVGSGKYYISPHLSSYLVGRHERSRSLLQKQPSLLLLTPTEKKILGRIAQNMTSKEIAAEMFLSVKTIENHRANMAKKLDLRGSHQLLKFALVNKSFLI